MSELSENDRNLVAILQKQGPQSVSALAEKMQVTETAIRQRLTKLTAGDLIARREERLSRGRPVHKYSLTRKGRQSMGQNLVDLASVVWEEIRRIEDETIRRQMVQGIARRLAEKYRSEVDQRFFESDPRQNRSKAAVIGNETSKNGASETEKTIDGASRNQETARRMQAVAEFFEDRGFPISLDSGQQTGSSSTADAKTNENLAKEDAASDSAVSLPVINLPVINLHGCPYPDLAEEDGLICEMEQAMFAELVGSQVELHRCSRNSDDCCSIHIDADPTESKQAESGSIEK